jgi:hypothetical protein
MLSITSALGKAGGVMERKQGKILQRENKDRRMVIGHRSDIFRTFYILSRNIVARRRPFRKD